MEPLARLEQARVMTLDPIVVKPPPEAENSATATVVHGKAKWQTCWRHACYLSKYVYKEPPPPNGFKTRFPEKMAEIEQHWEKWDELVDQEVSGLVARLFKAKGYDPSSKTDACPPILVFRGTDFEDMRDLVIWATVRLGFRDLSWPFEFPYFLDKTLDKNSSRQQLIANGFVPIPIYHDKGSIRVDGAVDGTWFMQGFELKLEILAKENGDWLNNIQQGLGRGSKQYDNAVKYGTAVVKEKIMSSKDKRLELTGHSLGGGLASAVCAVLDRRFPSVFFHAIVFNPSGVHPNTIRPATGADGLVHSFAVDDEILTTLQSSRGKLPLVGALFNLARRTINQDGMPGALGILQAVKGISPGKIDEKWNVPGKGSELPKLFPINEQTLVPPPKPNGFPELTNLDAMLRGSLSASLFAKQFLKHLNAQYRKIAQDSLKQFPDYYIHQLYKVMLNQYWRDLKPEVDALISLVEASVDYHGMDYVIATYDNHHGGSG